MSSDYYFRKFKQTLNRLQELVYLDIEYQKTEAHEKTSCLAAERLSSVLGQYIVIYNDIQDCLHHNLQVQKTSYIEAIIKTIVARIEELKNELRKLEVSNYHFFGHGLVKSKLTTFDVEITELPRKVNRPELIQKAIDGVLSKVKVKLEGSNKQELEEESVDSGVRWWDDEYVAKSKMNINGLKEVEGVLSEETLKRQQFINLIKSQEKSRFVIQDMTHKRQRRIRWAKELEGVAKPPAPYALREKAADIIQRVLRAYFESKRKKLRYRRRDEILGMYGKINFEARQQMTQLTPRRPQLMNNYEENWKKQCEDFKENFLKKNSDKIAEDYRDFIRSWLEKWYKDIKLFHDIPSNVEGGCMQIIKDEIPSPHTWLLEYEDYLMKTAENKGKSSQQLKFEKQEVKREKLRLKKDALLIRKMEAHLMKKIMKNPNLHPGYTYPESKITKHILEVIEDYYKLWKDLDIWNVKGVKEKQVDILDYEKACAEAKLQIVHSVDEDMRNELKVLKAALKLEHERNGETMLEPMKKAIKRRKRKTKVVTTLNLHIVEQLEYLAIHGYIKEYTKIGIEAFQGDPNFAGDDLRCRLEPAYAQNGEIRHVWWDLCREMNLGFKRVLLVGPRNSGKTMLIHILASINDAVLFELDVDKLPQELITTVFLQGLVDTVAACAKSVQPSIIIIRRVQKLYYLNVRPEQSEFLNTCLVKNLCKKFNRNDKVTIIGTCVDPWLAKSSQMLKKFPEVILVPNTTFSTVVDFLKTWVMSHAAIPKDLDIISLAHVLEGYPYGYLVEVLENFMTPERIIQIAARGLSSMDVYNFIIGDEIDAKVDYTKYRKWYEDKTRWGKREKKHLQRQKEFKLLVAEYEEKMRKKKKTPHLLELGINKIRFRT